MKYLVFGSSGRLGQLAINVLKKKSAQIYILLRNGDITDGTKKITNLYDDSAIIPFDHCLIDASVDYSSLDNMLYFEDIKRTFIYKQYLGGSLKKFITFSSGVVEFDEVYFKNDFYLSYKKEKHTLENFLALLQGVHIYCPRIFTLIGKLTYNVKTVGWVNVLDQVLSNKIIKIGKYDEKKTWVSEDLVSKKIEEFISISRNFGVSTPLSGTFTLKEVAIQSAFILNKEIEFVFFENDTWLSAPYFSKAKIDNLSDLSDELKLLIPSV